MRPKVWQTLLQTWLAKNASMPGLVRAEPSVLSHEMAGSRDGKASTPAAVPRIGE